MTHLRKFDFDADPVRAARERGTIVHCGHGRETMVARNSAFEGPLYVQGFTPRTLVQVGAFSSIASTQIGSVVIGRYCSIGPEVVTGANQHPTNWLTSARVAYVSNLHRWAELSRPHDWQQVISETSSFHGAAPLTRIGNDVWIGQRAFLKAGVTVGDGAIIAAGSIVTRDVPPWTIWGGNPARLIRERFPSELAERIAALQWWRYSLFDFMGADFSDPVAAMDLLEAKIAADEIAPYAPEVLRFE